MGFTLSIINAPVGATHWNGEYFRTYEEGFISSGALALDETWECPYDPSGVTNLRIRAFSMNDEIIILHDTHDIGVLGPIYNNKNYSYDCSTGILTVAVFDWTPLITVAVLSVVVGVLAVTKKGFK